MKYMMLERGAQQEPLQSLGEMAGYLEERCAGLSPDQAASAAAGGGFSLVEQCWHLADLEREGFGERIRRLLQETEPALEDFDGARYAAERKYTSRSLAGGIEAFRQARQENIAILRSIQGDDWQRRGTQEGVGRVALCDMPVMMAEHDASHRGEIEEWFRAR